MGVRTSHGGERRLVSVTSPGRTAAPGLSLRRRRAPAGAPVCAPPPSRPAQEQHKERPRSHRSDSARERHAERPPPPSAAAARLRVEEVQLPPRPVHVPRNLIAQLVVLEVLVPRRLIVEGQGVVVSLPHLLLRNDDELLDEAGVLAAGAGERGIPGVALGGQEAEEDLLAAERRQSKTARGRDGSVAPPLLVAQRRQASHSALCEAGGSLSRRRSFPPSTRVFSGPAAPGRLRKPGASRRRAGASGPARLFRHAAERDAVRKSRRAGERAAQDGPKLFIPTVRL